MRVRLSAASTHQHRHTRSAPGKELLKALVGFGRLVRSGTRPNEGDRNQKQSEPNRHPERGHLLRLMPPDIISAAIVKHGWELPQKLSSRLSLADPDALRIPRRYCENGFDVGTTALAEAPLIRFPGLRSLCGYGLIPLACFIILAAQKEIPAPSRFRPCAGPGQPPSIWTRAALTL